MEPMDIAAAAERIRPYVRRTPLLDARIDGRRLLLKLEHLQLSGSFKLRGAVNALLARPREEHVITASGGNHGLGVATAAGLLGRAATVFVPVTVPPAKARRIEAAGARLIRHGSTYAEAAAAAMAAAERPGCGYLHAYDDPAVIAGQGTVAAEVIEDAPEVDAIAVAVGGGGLAAGTALALAGRVGPAVGTALAGVGGGSAVGTAPAGAAVGGGSPAGTELAGAVGRGGSAAGTALAGGRRVTVAVEPENCQCFANALAAGRPVDGDVDSVAASALGATRVGALPFAILRSAPVESVLVSDKELLTARDLLWDHFRLAVEPAAAVPFAAWLAGRVPGDLPCLIVCGANTDWSPQD